MDNMASKLWDLQSKGANPNPVNSDFDFSDLLNKVDIVDTTCINDIDIFDILKLNIKIGEY